jgi:3',5'-cyclic AMP phosphodiesterase CpdA
MKKRMILLGVLLLAALTVCVCAALGESTEPERFLVISDTHLTKETQEHAAMLEAVVQAARGMDAVLLLGDNTNNTHPEEHVLVLDMAEEIRRRSGAEVYILPGNHDYSALRMGPKEFRAQYGAYGWNQAFSQDKETASCAVMTRGGTCLLLLDTNMRDGALGFKADGGIGGSTLVWLQETLEALPDGTPVLACGHHPILPPDRNERTPGANALSQVLRAYGAGLYLCGHDHGFATAEEKGLRQITVGRPQAYPGWVGIVEKEETGFRWHTEGIYDAQSPFYIALREGAYALADTMARGTLSTTPYADDEAAIAWFVSAYMLLAGGEMTPEKNAALLADDNCQKWREAETRTLAKEWMLNLLENCPEDVRRIDIPAGGKHPLKLEK